MGNSEKSISICAQSWGTWGICEYTVGDISLLRHGAGFVQKLMLNFNNMKL